MGVRGYFFSLDGIVAVSIIATGLLLLSQMYSVTPPVTRLNYLSTDLMQVFSVMKVGEANNSYIRELIATGVITNNNNTILEQIGEFYVSNHSDLIQSMVANLTQGVVSSSISMNVSINNETLFSLGSTAPSTILVGKRMISGIEKEKPTLGFVARAFALKTKKNNTLVVMGDVISSSVRKSSGDNTNRVNITYYVDLPDALTVLDAYWFIEASYTDNRFRAFINNTLLPGGDQTGDHTYTALGSRLNPGRNKATVEFRNGGSGPIGGDDGATHFIVTYNTTEDTVKSLTTKPFALVDSNCSLQYKKPVFVLGDIRSITINLSLIARNVTLYYVLNSSTYYISIKNVTSNAAYWNDSEIRASLASRNHSYANLNNRYFWFIVELDKYISPENIGTKRRILDNSFVYIDHTQSSALYGKIDISQIVPVYSQSSAVGGGFYRNAEWRFNRTNFSNALMVDSQFAWMYETGHPNPAQRAYANTWTLYNNPPEPFILEFVRFGYKDDYIINGTNSFGLAFGDGYSVNPANSLIYYTFLVDNMVPYGGTYSTAYAALADAGARLNQTLGSYVSATDISSDTVAVGGVPSLWGPSTIEVRVWQ